jgi:hypothetical protein
MWITCVSAGEELLVQIIDDIKPSDFWIYYCIQALPTIGNKWEFKSTPCHIPALSFYLAIYILILSIMHSWLMYECIWYLGKCLDFNLSHLSVITVNNSEMLSSIARFIRFYVHCLHYMLESAFAMSLDAKISA